MRETQTEVLVVGAGPVGLFAALELHQSGVEVTVIERDSRTAARSYACALHPHTLSRLKTLGLLEDVLKLGRRVDKVAFYDGNSRQGELNLAALPSEFPFLLVLPQSAFESVLATKLRQTGVALHWSHRFVEAMEETHEVVSTVEELAGTSTGYIVPHWETTVKERMALRSQFLLGTDGFHSTVRQSLHIDNQTLGEPEVFAAFEFETDDPVADEVRVVLDDSTTNVLWPLPDRKYRWTFQLLRSEFPESFPEKERRAVRLLQPEMDERIRQYVQTVAGRRAPWFSAAIKDVTWCSEVRFQRRMASSFGHGRCWLAGDAAHQTGPVGVQSMNAGFAEVEMLAQLISRIQKQKASLEIMGTYEKAQNIRWHHLLGKSGALKNRAQTNTWAAKRAGRLLSCLPGLDSDLSALATQLGLDWLDNEAK